MNMKSIPNEPLSVRERLTIFFERLRQAPPCASADDALALVCQTLDAVEDEWSGIEKNPNAGFKFDGRMYPPRADFTYPQSDGSKIALIKGHEVRLGINGSISIRSRSSGAEEFSKGGQYEKTV